MWFSNPFNGIVNRDRWRPYERFGRRQLCWSHQERDLQAIIDGAGVGGQSATTALAGADAMFAAWGKFKDGLVSRAELRRDTRKFRQTFMAFCVKGASQKRDRRWRPLGRDLLRQWQAVFCSSMSRAWSPRTTPPSADSGRR